MAFIKHGKLKAEVAKEGAPKTAERLVEAIKAEQLSFHDFSIKHLFEDLVYEKGKPNNSCGMHLLEDRFTEESGSFTSFDAFNVVVSQLLVNLTTTRFNSADYTIQRLFKVVPTNFINGEKLPGISNLGALTQPQLPGRKLEEIEFTQDYVETPPHRMFGGLLSLSKQLIASDNSGEIVRTASKMIDALYMGREYEAIVALTGIGSTAEVGRVKYKQKGTTYLTYDDASSTRGWDNLVASQSSLTITSLNACMLALMAITDPYSGQPISSPSGRLTLVVCPELIFAANNIKRSTQYLTGENSSSNYVPQLRSSDPVASLPFDFDIVVSKYLKAHLDANSTASTGWWLGWHSEAFAWMQQFAPQSDEALMNAGDSFERVLGAKYRVFRSETCATIEPRYVIKATT